jgi:uncharacterized protein (TIGR00730 family)
MPQYELTRAFARLWSEKHGDTYPIMTGGGPGLMEAGNRGAKEAGKKSLFYATYFGNNNEPTNDYVTDGYMFASFAQREADMVDRAMAIVVGQGGFGTEWEIYESLSKMQTGKKHRVPLVLLGTQADWATLIARINYLASIKTISPDDVNLLVIAETPEKAVAIIEESISKKQ